MLEKQLYLCDHDFTGEVRAVSSKEMNFLPLKPIGGLWTSSYIDKEELSDWANWCRGSEFRDVDRQRKFLITPKEKTKVFTIDKIEDLLSFSRHYGYSRDNGQKINIDSLIESESFNLNSIQGMDVSYVNIVIDYNKVKKDYDCVHFTYNILSYRMPVYMRSDGSIGTIPHAISYLVYPLDCECTLWLKSSFEKIEELG